MTLLSMLVAICAMVVLYAAHRWQTWAFRALLCGAFAASVIAHGLNARVWFGASLFYVAVSWLTVDAFQVQSRQWLTTLRWSLLTVSALTAIAWGLNAVKYLPLEPAIGVSLTALSLLLAAGLIYATAPIPSRNAWLRLAIMAVCAALSDVVVFGVLGRSAQIDPSSRLAMLAIAVVSGAWFLQVSRSEKAVAVSQRRAFDSLLGTLETLTNTTNTRLTGEQMLSLSTLTDTTTQAAGVGVGSLESWKRLLEAAVILVPGAEGGSIRIRDGDGDFVFVAQQGFSDALLGLRVNARQASDWHGDLLEWHSGRARMVKRPFDTHVALDSDPEFYPTETKRIRANLYFPVVVDGNVMAEINLDSFSAVHAFSDESLTAAKQFALQIAALVKAQREKSKLTARLREFELLELITGALHDASTPEIVAAVVVRETVRLVNVPNAAMLLMNTEQTSLRFSSGVGLFEPRVGDGVPWGHGLSWSAIQSRETIESQDASNDSKSASPHAKPFEQLTVPLFDSDAGPLGTLMLSRESQRGFTKLEKRLVEVIGSVAAGTLERVRVARDLQVQVKESQNLLSLAQLLEGNDEQSLLTALERVRLLGKADAAVITDATNGLMTTRLQTGTLTKALRDGLKTGMSLENARLISQNRVSFQVTQTQTPELRQALQRFGVTATFAVLISEANSVVLYRFSGDGWSATERQTLEAAARMLGALVGRLERLKSLENGYASALKTIGLALEMRDLETANHTERVAVLSSAVAEQLRVPEAERLAIRWGAYLHDIGKFGVPDTILQKAVQLSEAETAVMREHPQLGFVLVRDLAFLPDAARDIVRYHHERWDGRGYPAGLAGEAIPLSARIFAVCDVFDALRSKRVYKPALSLAASLLELRREAEDGHLELRLVEALEEVIQRNPQRLEAALYPA